MKKNIKFKVIGLIVTCVSFLGGGYFVVNSEFGYEMELFEVVEAKSGNYVQPYIEENYIGVDSKQSEVLEDSDSVEDNIEVIETPEKEEVLDENTVEVEYISRKEFIGEVPNEMNEIIIAMYHGIDDSVENSDTVHRSVKGFKQDLQMLYDKGYRVITMEDLMTNNINVPKGYTPIVLTFDDGLSTQLSFNENSEGKLILKENTAVAIINEFNEKHPDFGQHGMFYLYTSQRPFKGKGTFTDCLEYLLANGYEVGAHTYSHSFLNQLSEEKIQEEMAYNVADISNNSDKITSTDIKYLAYPYGVMPEDELGEKYLLQGSYGSGTYNFNSAVLAAPNLKTSTLIYSNSFDSLKIGRYRGTNNEVLDLSWKVKRDEKIKGNKFISDGDPNTVTILKKDFKKVNLEALGNKKLRIITD